MIEKQIEDFSIEQIAKSGQCFRIHKEKDGSFSNVAFGKYLRIIQKNEQVLFDCSETEFEEISPEPSRYQGKRYQRLLQCKAQRYRL